MSKLGRTADRHIGRALNWGIVLLAGLAAFVAGCLAWSFYQIARALLW
jgi:hypothetical protein